MRNNSDNDDQPLPRDSSQSGASLPGEVALSPQGGRIDSCPEGEQPAATAATALVMSEADALEEIDFEDEVLIGRLRRAFEYRAPALAFPGLCTLGQSGGSNAAFSGVQEAEILAAGTRLGEFEIVEELGRGGMGVVYRARQNSLGRDVALKVLPPCGRYGRQAVQRFLTEARAASRLHHTNIVSIYAQGEYQGQFHYAMELIEGASVDAVLRDEAELLGGIRAAGQAMTGVLPSVRAAGGGEREIGPPVAGGTPAAARAAWTAGDFRCLAALLAETAEALEYAHRQGVVHRDVKPHNLLWGRNNRLYLTDFGLAYLVEEPHVTVRGEVMGTPAYLSPEQIRGNPLTIDRRTDIYSLGVTLYELITGRRPFRAASREQVMFEICGTEPTAPRRLVRQIPVDLETICRRAMEKVPQRRYATAGQLAEDLRRFAEGRRIVSRRPGRVIRTARWVRRHPPLAALAAGLLVMAFLALGWAGNVQLGRQREAQRLLQWAYEQLAYSDFHQPELVAEEIERAAALGADRRELHVVRALASLGGQDAQGAIGHLEACLAEAPGDLRAWYMLAWAYRSAGQAGRALEVLERAEAAGPPTTADAFFFRGLALHFADPAAATESYRQATVLRARGHGFYPQAVLHLARARNQQLYATRSLDSFPEVVASLTQLVEHAAYGAYPYYLLSIAHRLAAEVYLGSAGTRGDALVEHHFSQALEWARRGQAAEPASDRPPTAEAECLESMGRFAEAVAARTQAIAAATKDVSRWEGYHYRWRLRYWLGDFAGALSDLAACAAFDPDNRFYAYVYPALVRAESGDRAGALAQARALAEEHPHNPQDQLWAATCLRLLGQETAARDLLQGPAGADLDFTSGLVPPQTPEWVRALYAYACAGGSPQDLEESTLQVSGSWRLWGELHFHTGALHLAQGDRSRALSAFRRAYRSFDSERRYTYHAKLICIQMDADPTWPHWIDGVEHEPEAPATASEAAAPPAALIEREESYVER